MKKILTGIVLSAILINPVFSKNPTNWVFQTNGRIYSSPVLDEGQVYFGSGDHHFYALNNETGVKAWDFETGGPVHSSAAIGGNTIVFGSADGSLYALEKSNGNPIWQFESQGEVMLDLWDYYLSSPAIDEGTVYWGSGDGNLYAIDIEKGTLKWKFTSGSIIHAEPLVNEGRVLVGNYNGDFFCLDKINGEVIWQFRTVGATYFPNGEVQKGASIDQGIVYFGSRDYNIYALDVKTGRGKWNMKEQGSWVIATPLVYGDNIYAGTSDTHRFYCINKTSGEVVWQIETPMRVYGSALAHGDVVYFGCFDGKLRGVDPSTGDLRWSFQTESSRLNYHTIYDENGKFREGFQIYGKDYLEAEATIHSLGSILSTPAIQDNNIFFGSSDGKMYSVKIND